MIANPEGQVPKVHDFWFQDPELRYYKTEKDCQSSANEILKWARQSMEDKELTVIDTWFECIEVQKNEQASSHNQHRGYQTI